MATFSTDAAGAAAAAAANCGGFCPVERSPDPANVAVQTTTWAHQTARRILDSSWRQGRSGNILQFPFRDRPSTALPRLIHTGGAATLRKTLYSLRTLLPGDGENLEEGSGSRETVD